MDLTAGPGISTPLAMASSINYQPQYFLWLGIGPPWRIHPHTDTHTDTHRHIVETNRPKAVDEKNNSRARMEKKSTKDERDGKIHRQDR